MPLYRVIWEIDVAADTPRKAAKRARRYQTREGTTAVVFDVIEHDSDGEPVRVDLLDPDSPE